jgi:L-methionine (R)-S-oxide reductase
VDEESLTAALVEATTGSGKRDQRAGQAAGIIRHLGGYRWVGIYDVGADEIALLGWDGPAAPAHPRFPRTQGLCGAAVAAGRPVIVDDVQADPRYLTTHATTRSEMVVPVLAGDRVAGLIDVEGEGTGAFGQRDQQLLERCARLIAALWGRHSDRTTL